MFKHTTRRALSLILTLAAALSIAVTPLTAEAAGKGALTVLPYDSGGSANGGAIVVQSGGKLGLIDKAGKQLVPVEYDNYSCPNNEGYTIFYKGISAIDDWAGGGSSYLFDKSGKKVWESSEKLLYSYTEGVMQIREVVYTHDNGKPFYAVTYQTLDGKIIKAPEKPDDLIYDAVLSATPFLDGTAFLIYPEVYNTYTNDEGAVRFAWDSDYTKVLDINGTLETLADDYVTYYAASAGYTIARWSDTDSYGLYSLKTRSFFGPHCGFSYEWRRNPDTNGVKVTNFGTLAIFRLNEYSGSYFPAVPEDKLNGKLYLFDFAQPPVNVTVYGSERQTMIPISGGYDYIFPSATEKWFQISPDGERWGYVSRDGKTEKFFDDAGQFYGRKAIVKDGEKIYVVDDSFTAISNEITGYDSVASVGDGVFSLRKGDEHFIAVYEGDEPAPAPAAPASVTAVYAAQTAKLVKTSGTTGVSLTTDVSLTAYTIAGNNYIKLRDFALIMDGSSSQFDLSWDGANNAINILYGKPYKAVGGEGAPLKEGNQQAILSTSKILLDGKEVSLTAYTILENNYFKIRDIAQLLGFDVDWRDGGIWVEPEEAYTPD